MLTYTEYKNGNSVIYIIKQNNICRNKDLEKREEALSAKQISGQRDTWLCAGGATITITVQVTPDDMLAQRVRENLQNGRQPSRKKTKVVEDGGTSSKRSVVK